jgi:hypothetical protein
LRRQLLAPAQLLGGGWRLRSSAAGSVGPTHVARSLLARPPQRQVLAEAEAALGQELHAGWLSSDGGRWARLDLAPQLENSLWALAIVGGCGGAAAAAAQGAALLVLPGGAHYPRQVPRAQGHAPPRPQVYSRALQLQVGPVAALALAPLADLANHAPAANAAWAVSRRGAGEARALGSSGWSSEEWELQVGGRVGGELLLPLLLRPLVPSTAAPDAAGPLRTTRCPLQLRRSPASPSPAPCPPALRRRRWCPLGASPPARLCACATAPAWPTCS